MSIFLNDDVSAFNSHVAFQIATHKVTILSQVAFHNYPIRLKDLNLFNS